VIAVQRMHRHGEIPKSHCDLSSLDQSQTL
jgi:hypothetical protein